MHLDNAIQQALPPATSERYEPITYQIIPEENHQCLPNALTNEKLSLLEQFSKTIEQPNIPGQFSNEKHYLETLKLVLESTHETRNRIDFLMTTILPALASKNALLDVGPGDGSITKVLSPSFQHLTAVDSNLKILNELEFHLAKTIDVLTLESSILNAPLENNAYDLALLSHILYYIAPQEWINVVNSTYESLKNDGLLVIALGGDELEKGELIHFFGGVPLKIDSLARTCMNLFAPENVRLYASTESFVTRSADVMFHIAAFMLADANITAKKEDLLKYIHLKFKRSNGCFEMTTKQKYIVIKKQLKTDVPHDPEKKSAFYQSKN